MYLEEEMKSFLLLRQPFSPNTYTTAVASFKHRLRIGLLSFALGCALFITSQNISWSMSLRCKLQTYLESSVSFLYRPLLKDFFMIRTSESKLSRAQGDENFVLRSELTVSL